jgi:hypothetical protein
VSYLGCIIGVRSSREQVLGIEQLAVPIPDQPTYFCITLDNGIDYIRTPYSVLVDGAKVNQEFSLLVAPFRVKRAVN